MQEGLRTLIGYFRMDRWYWLRSGDWVA